MPQDQNPDPGISSTGNIELQTGRPANTLSGFITSMVNIHAARQQQAGSQLDRMLKAAGAGFPIDPKAVEKTAKKAGLPLMSPDDMKGLKGGAQAGQPGENAPENQAQGNAAPDPHAQAFNVKSIADVGERQKKQTELSIDGLIRNKVLNSHLQGANDTQVLENTKQMLDLKSKAMGGDPVALGTLYRMGDAKIDLQGAAFNGMSDKQKGAFISTMAGYESPAELATRVSNTAHSLVTEGRFDNLDDATKYATAVANGTPVPQDLADKAITHPLQDMVKAADSMDTFAHMGYSGDQLVGIARNFAVMGLNALPTGAQNLYVEANKVAKENAQSGKIEAGAAASNAATRSKELTGFDKKDASGRMVHIEGTAESEMSKLQVARDEQRVQMAKVDAVMKSKDDKDFLAGFAQNSLDFRAGKIPVGVMDQWTKELVQRSGGVVTEEEVKHWYKSNEMKQNYSWPAKGDTSGDAPGAP